MRKGVTHQPGFKKMNFGTSIKGKGATQDICRWKIREIIVIFCSKRLRMQIREMAIGVEWKALDK